MPIVFSRLRFRTFQNPATQLELLDDLIEPALAKPNDQGIIRVQLTAPDLRVSIKKVNIVKKGGFTMKLPYAPLSKLKC